MEKKMIQKQTEFRSVELKAEVRSEEGKPKKMILRGYAIVFDTPAKIRTWWGDEYEETITRDALSKTNLTDTYLLGFHRDDHLLGRNGVNMRLEADETGLFFESDLPNTQYARDDFNLVECGILDGVSFGFTTDNEIDWTTKKRTITEITNLYEISLTSFPAYREACVIAMRAANIPNPAEEGKKTEAPGAIEDEAAEKARAELENKLKKLEEM